MTAGEAVRIEILADQFNDQMWRLNNLYKIVNKDAKLVDFRMNDAQLKFMEELWYRNVILKARQFGFTTLMCIFGLDSALWNNNFNAGIIAHTLPDAEKIFRTKVKVPYLNLPDEIRDGAAAKMDRTKEYVFANESSIGVSASYRSGTLQLLHVSEFGKIAAKRPEAAREIATGAVEALPKDGIAVFESTAEGNAGRFFDMVEEARNKAADGSPLTRLEYKFHFQPWWESPEYELSNKESHQYKFREEELAYFEKLANPTELNTEAIELSVNKRAWYAAKWRTLDDDMMREYPSTPDEAFMVAIEGAYLGKQMRRLREAGHICKIPIVRSLPVYTFWDLGRNDANAIWFMQHVGREHRFIDYYENEGHDLSHYARVLDQKAKKLGYLYKRHYLPHDVEVVELTRSDNKSREEVLIDLGVKPIEVVERIHELREGIEMMRQALPGCFFDVTRCAQGVKALDNYRREWDEKTADWKDEPMKNFARHGADAFRQYAQGYIEKRTKSKKKVIKRSWRNA